MRKNILALNSYFIYAALITAIKGNDEACQTLKYKPMKDKPDLLIEHELEWTLGSLNSWAGFCRVNEESHAVLEPEAFEGKKIMGLDYDPLTKTIFANGLTEIMKIPLESGKVETIYRLTLHERFSFGSIMDIAYDWVAKNLYVRFDKIIGVISLNGDLKYKNLFEWKEYAYPSIVVHPNKGYLFIRFNGTLIYRTNLDGSNPIEFIRYNNADAYIYEIAIDQYDDRLYWWTQGKNQSIRFADVETGEEKTLLTTPMKAHSSIAVDAKYIYYSPDETPARLHRVFKDNGVRDKKFEVISDDSRIKKNSFYQVECLEEKKVNEDHPCKENNGGCDDFCFAVSVNGTLEKRCSLADQ